MQNTNIDAIATYLIIILSLGRKEYTFYIDSIKTHFPVKMFEVL